MGDGKGEVAIAIAASAFLVTWAPGNPEPLRVAQSAPASFSGRQDIGLLCEQLVDPLRSATVSEALAEPGSSALRDDRDWEKYGRRGGSQIKGCLALSNWVRPDKLYRCKELNPRDTYIPVGARSQFDAAFDIAMPRVQAVDDAVRRAKHIALSEAQAAGMLREARARPRIDVDRGLMSIDVHSLADEGMDMGTTIGGQVMGIGSRELPGLATALEVGDLAGREFAFFVIQFFELFGTLSSVEADALRQQAMAAAQPR